MLKKFLSEEHISRLQEAIENKTDFSEEKDEKTRRKLTAALLAVKLTTPSTTVCCLPKTDKSLGYEVLAIAGDLCSESNFACSIGYGNKDYISADSSKVLFIVADPPYLVNQFMI